MFGWALLSKGRQYHLNEMKSMRRIIIFLIAFGVDAESWAQDIHFSQYELSFMSSSCAMIGDFDGEGRLTLANRSQWRSVSGVPYQTRFFQGEGKFFKNRFSVAGSCWHDRAGDGIWNQYQFNLGGSYHLFKDTMKVNLYVGAGVSLRQWNWDPDQLTWGHQWDGFSFNSDIAGGESFGIQGKQTGLHFGLGFKMHWNQHLLTHLSWGGYNLFSSTMYMGQSSVNWYRRNVIQQNTKWYFHPRHTLYLTQTFSQQSPSKEWVHILKDNWILDDRDWNKWGISYGLGFRTRDAMMLVFGGNYRNHEISFCYDINGSDLNGATQGRGGWEVYYRWIWKKPKPLKVRKEICPEYY
jgi:hypothetical protein